MAQGPTLSPGSSGQGFDPAAMRATLADYFDDLRTWRMPFGRYKGSPIHALPLEYLQWFENRGGFPAGRLGELMAFVCQTKTDGAELIFAHLRSSRGLPRPPRPDTLST